MKKIITIAFAALLSGCVSTVAHFRAGCWGEPYIGTQGALCCAGEQPVLWADVPFEVILDTVLLPIDLICMPFVK